MTKRPKTSNMSQIFSKIKLNFKLEPNIFNHWLLNFYRIRWKNIVLFHKQEKKRFGIRISYCVLFYYLESKTVSLVMWSVAKTCMFAMINLQKLIHEAFFFFKWLTHKTLASTAHASGLKSFPLRVWHLQSSLGILYKCCIILIGRCCRGNTLPLIWNRLRRHICNDRRENVCITEW